MDDFSVKKSEKRDKCVTFTPCHNLVTINSCLFSNIILSLHSKIRDVRQSFED